MSIEPTLDWERLLETVRADRPDLYRAWFASLQPTQPFGGALRVAVSDPAQAYFLRAECRQAFAEAAMKVSGHLLSVEFASRQEVNPKPLPASEPPALTTMPLNPDYTFEQFVVGASNRLAHAACGAVCNQPGTLYNPLFIHGASGLGKTHLLQGTCAAVEGSNPALKVLYLTCETFVNDFVRAIASGQWQPFRECTRQADILAIDGSTVARSISRRWL